MKLEITTSVKNVEMANYILAQAIKRLKGREDILELTPQEVEQATKFRRSLVKTLLHAIANEGNVREFAKEAVGRRG